MQVAKNSAGQLVYAWNARKNNNYFCPVCGHVLKYCHGNYKQPYFAHINIDCQQGGPETNEHLLGKRQLLNWALNHHWQASLEFYIPQISQRPDLLVSNKNKQMAIEFQCSPLSLQRLAERNHGYRRLNLNFIWYLGSPYKIGLHRAKRAQFTQLFAGKPALIFWDVRTRQPQYRFLSLQSDLAFQYLKNPYDLEKIVLHHKGLAEKVYKYHRSLACCPLLSHRLNASLCLTSQDEFSWRVLLCLHLERLSLGTSATQKQWDRWLAQQTDWLKMPCVDQTILQKWHEAKADQFLQDLIASACIQTRAERLILVAKPYWFKTPLEKMARIQRLMMNRQ